MSAGTVVVVGGSAGGLEAVRTVLGGLPAGFGASVLVVLHIPPGGGRALARILDRAGPLPAALAEDGAPLQPGRVVVCVPDHHLTLLDGRVSLRRGPRENGHRPSVDALFRTAARYYGPHAVGVVLSGTLSDGTAGLRAIRRQGGLAVVQDPEDAAYEGMPASALNLAGADHVVPAGGIGPLLADLVEELDGSSAGPAMASTDDRVLEPSEFSCPDCGGVLWWADEQPRGLALACRVGHRWATDDLLVAQRHEFEQALWVALRAIEDREALQARLADRAAQAGRAATAERYRNEREALREQADLLRSLIEEDGWQGANG